MRWSWIMALLLLSVAWMASYSTNLQKPLPFGNKRTAYKYHYRGTLEFHQGNYQKATTLFEKAYRILPENFHFKLALALSYGYNGQAKKAADVLQSSSQRLSPQSEEYAQQEAFLAFTQGIVHCFNGDYGGAVTNFEQSIDWQKGLEEKQYLSIFYNALGFATTLNQGRSSHRRADIAPHMHVHRRDFEKARLYFEKALQADPSNASAWHNYRILSDSLELSLEVQYDSLGARKGKKIQIPPAASGFLPSNMLRALELTHSDEVVFLVDVSGSMVMEKVTCLAKTRFEVMRETALMLLEQVDTSIALGLGSIGGNCEEPPANWSAVGSLSKKEMHYAIRFLIPDGTTPLLSRLQEAPELFSGIDSTAKTIFLVSDGENLCNIQGLDICDWVETLKRKNIQINILTFLHAAYSNVNAFAEYTCLADITNGQILYLDDLRCSLEYHEFNLVEATELYIPEFQRVDCWGESVKDLWAIFSE